MRLMLRGSAPLSPELIDAFTARTGIPIHQGYGLTEAAPVVTTTLCSEELQPGSVGAALPGIEIRLVDETGQPPEGEDPGEIQIRGANLFSGYWPDGVGRPRRARAGGPPATSASSTRRGDLYLVDRLKELVIVSGFNVYPIEVEDVIREVAGRHRGRRHRRRRRADRRGGRRLRRRAPAADADGVGATPSARTASSGWPGSSSRAASRSSPSCRSTSPARSRRAGCAAWSGGARSGLLEQ